MGNLGFGQFGDLTAQVGPDASGSGLAGQLGVVVGRRHLDAVHAHHVQGRQPFQQGQQLRAAQATGLGRAGAGCKGRVQAVDVQRCLAAGAVDQVYPVGELEAAGDALALQLAHMAPHSLAAIKYLSNETPHLSLQAYLSLEQQLLRNCAQTSDAIEGITAFIEKRHPEFTGR